jgi:dipeptidyl aminopeptidase/acylaminoacyl peptidase
VGDVFESAARRVRGGAALRPVTDWGWELAVYPVEDHGFIEATSWADEYKRILELFDTNLKR